MHDSDNPTLTAEQIMLVQTSFARVQPIADTAAALFYNRLFELDPDVRRLFTSDMHVQGRKLMTMLGTVIGYLHKLQQLVPAIQSLGERHREYGVQPRHYATVGAALLWTLEQGLGEQWTPAMCAAWERAYNIVAATMLAAASAPSHA